MIALINYGAGNLRSVAKALEQAGGEVKITENPKDLLDAEALVLPGVGAFSQVSDNLKKAGFTEPLREEIISGKPYLGICLGMHFLFAGSEEGSSPGLNIIPGEVKKFPQQKALKVPHMGWNGIQFKGSSPLLEGIASGTYYYFCHSYYVAPKDKEAVLTTTDYGQEFTSAVSRKNIFGVQFHPEKSGAVGIKLLENFVRISRN